MLQKFRLKIGLRDKPDARFLDKEIYINIPASVSIDTCDCSLLQPTKSPQNDQTKKSTTTKFVLSGKKLNMRNSIAKKPSIRGKAFYSSYFKSTTPDMIG